MKQLTRLIAAVAALCITMDAGSAESCSNISGDWSFLTSNVTSSCGSEADWLSTITVSQSGCSLEITGIKDEPFAVAGDIVGNTVTIGPVGLPDEGGTTTSTFVLTLASETTMTGNESWTWQGAGAVCSNGTSDVTATKTPNYTMGSQATLRIELSGTGYGEFDAIEIDGTATLNGTLEVTLGSGYTPSPGDSFTFIVAESITGQFNNVILPDIGDNSFEISINDGFAVIMVTSTETPVTPLPVIVKTTVEGTLDSLTLDVEDPFLIIKKPNTVTLSGHHAP